MRKLLIILLLLQQFTANLSALTVDEWFEKYNRSCLDVKVNHVCKEKLNSNLKKMKASKVPEILVGAGLPLWISTVPIIESGYNNKAESKAGAIGLFQIMKFHCTLYFTKRRLVTMPLRSGSGLKLVKTIIETKPTIEACKGLLEDPEINARIAAWLLIKLYRKYRDWNLSLQAFNIGEPQLDRFLSGKRKTLPFETSNYFSQLMAIQKYIEKMR